MSTDKKIRHTPGRFYLDGDAFSIWHTDPLHEVVITAPHDCDVPRCPGAENKRRLEEHERALRAISSFLCHHCKADEIAREALDEGTGRGK